MHKFYHFLLHFTENGDIFRTMKTKITKTSNVQKGLAHIMAKPFTEKEKETIKLARQKSGIDRPTFYHNAVISYAATINSEGGSNA